MPNKVLSLTREYYRLHPELLNLHFLATLQAVHELSGFNEKPDDWNFLLALNAQKAPCSFNVLYKTFHRGHAGYSNFKYYAVLCRLGAKGFVKMEYNKRGWRLWSITPEGRQAIARLNEAALRYLPD